tara:strand:- start:4 stop:105 length:102 start_codon:yes stop_codon:yes gene_type:complete
MATKKDLEKDIEILRAELSIARASVVEGDIKYA